MEQRSRPGLLEAMSPDVSLRLKQDTGGQRALGEQQEEALNVHPRGTLRSAAGESSTLSGDQRNLAQVQTWEQGGV